ncbi:MAG: hypothetical protein ACR2IE_10685 [Candidatus Sumerlaeaceae bacterium]
MLEPESTKEHKSFPDVLILLLLCAGALFLRWYRLDVISFRYDTADALFRAREIARGHWPLLGIVNSLGFHNPPGLPWAILPALIVSPSPEVATAWFGLLTITGILPIYGICRSQIGRWSFLLPCSAYALMPNMVVAGRNIWAQWLMPAIFAWVLLFLIRAVLKGHRPLHDIGLALALTWIGLAVHLSGVVYLPLVLVCAALAARRNSWSAAQIGKVLALGCLPALLLVPSVFDYFRTEGQGTAQKPAHIEKFESLMPPPEPLLRRLQGSLSGEFNLFANTAQARDVPKHTALLSGFTTAAKVTDGLLLLAALVGVACAGMMLARGRGGAELSSGFSGLLLAWIFVPTIIGCVFAPRANSTYFTPAIPALLLSTALLPQLVAKKSRLRRVWLSSGVLATIAVVTVYMLFNVGLFRSIAASPVVQGQYYIPLKDQRAFAEVLAQRGVSQRRLTHLSGEWFQRPYNYLLREVYQVPEVTAEPKWAVMEDVNLRTRQQARVKYFYSAATLHLDTVGAVLFDSAERAKEFVDAYYRIPTEQNVAE